VIDEKPSLRGQIRDFIPGRSWTRMAMVHGGRDLGKTFLRSSFDMASFGEAPVALPGRAAEDGFAESFMAKRSDRIWEVRNITTILVGSRNAAFGGGRKSRRGFDGVFFEGDESTGSPTSLAVAG